MTTPYEARTSAGAHLDGAHELELQQLRDCNREGRFNDVPPILARILGLKRAPESMDVIVAKLVASKDLSDTVRARTIVGVAERELKLTGFEGARRYVEAAHAALGKTELSATDIRLYRMEAAAALRDGRVNVARDLMRQAAGRIDSIVADGPTLRQRAELENSNTLALIELEEGRFAEARAVLASTAPYRDNPQIDGWNVAEHRLLEALATYDEDHRVAQVNYRAAAADLDSENATFERAKCALLWGRYSGDATETEFGIQLFEKLGAHDIVRIERRRIADSKARRERSTRVDRELLQSFLPNGFPLFSDAWHELLSNLYRQLEGGNFEFTLIVGPTGAGKSIIVQFIHKALSALHGRKSSFSAHNLASTKDTVKLEIELFGQMKKTFTDVDGKDGALALASGGTVFLDEIGNASIELQRQLLKVIDEHQFRPMGSTALKLTPCDVAFVAATNADPSTLVATGEWQHDFLARVTRSVVDLPPLAGEPGVSKVANYFKDTLLRKSGRGRLGFSIAAYAYLETQEWPENLRGLQALIAKTVASLPPDADAITVTDLERANGRNKTGKLETPPTDFLHLTLPNGDTLQIPAERVTDEFLAFCNAMATDTPHLEGGWTEIVRGLRAMMIRHYVEIYGSQRSAADALGISKGTISHHLENGRGAE